MRCRRGHARSLFAACALCALGALRAGGAEGGGEQTGGRRQAEFATRNAVRVTEQSVDFMEPRKPDVSSTRAQECIAIVVIQILVLVD